MKPEPTSLIRRIHGAMFKLPYMITCEQFEDFILAYLEDELPSRQKFVFELHLRMCRECRDYLAAYQKTMRFVKASASDKVMMMAEPPPEDLVAAVLAARRESLS